MVEKDDVGGRRPALDARTLGHEPQPRAVRLLDLVDPENVLLLTPGEVLAAPLVVNDLVADLEHGAVLGDHPLADPAVLGLGLKRGRSRENACQQEYGLQIRPLIDVNPHD
ncbi:MAG TPA: hypothetical protein VKA15_14145 [Isosphaeraceae bacterium]|nr:hypothetical protein [Isosphaeraceae bacterium]